MSSNNVEPGLLGGIRDIVLQASMAVEKYFGSGTFEVTEKPGEGPLTDADLKSNEILNKGLLNLLPGSAWLSEESVDDPGRLGADYVWIVDPIDGTREFVNDIPEFSISTGLVYQSKCIAGAIALPADQRIIYGGRGQPLSNVYYRFGTDPEWPSIQKEPISYEHSKDLIGSRVLVSRTEWAQGKFEPLLGDFEFEPTGSIARKLALLAAGETDMVISLKPKNDWDICGGYGLIESISGMKIVTLRDEEPRVFNESNTKSFGLCAGPERLVDSFLKYFKQKKLVVDETYY